MFSRVSIVLFMLVMCFNIAQAQGNLETGFFIGNLDSKIEEEPFGVTFRGDLSGEDPSAGLSIRVGRMIFGLETLGGSSYQSGSMTGVGSDGGSTSSGFISSVGPTHRAMMGLRLSRNVALYGFHGLAGYSIQHELSYKSSTNVETVNRYQVEVQGTQTRYNRCGRAYQVPVSRLEWQEETINATHMTTGFSSGDFDGLQNSIGAGIEAFLFGGVLRVEYNMVHTNGFTQSAKLNHSTTDTRLQNTNDQDTYQYEWKGNTEQRIQLRWKASF